MNQTKEKQLLTVPEAAEFLKISKNSVLVAIKSKKLKAIRNGYYWNILLKNLEAYDALRKKALSAGSKRAFGINSKGISFLIIEKEIAESGIQNIKITKNFEIHRGNSLKNLINEKGIDAEALYFLYAHIYENHLDRFFHDDTEMSFDVFLHRLMSLRSFLERTSKSFENNKPMLSSVKAAIRAISSLPTDWVKIEACTGRLLTDQGPMFFGPKRSMQIQRLLRDFCSQGEFTANEILTILKSLK